MGRKKTYDRDELIRRATAVFRRHGYTATSTQMLVEALGVNRSSLYAEFGSKQTLFEAVLARYEDDAMQRNFGALEAPEAGLAAVHGLFDRLAMAASGPAAGLGCLLCNTVVELGGAELTGQDFGSRYFERISAALSHALTNARRRGELDESVDVASEARFLTASILGLFVMVRAQAAPAMANDVAARARAHLETLTRAA